MSKRVYLALFLIVGSILVGGLSQWGTSTIHADLTDPAINHAATTSGPMAYGDGYLSLLMFVDENQGIELASVEVRTTGGLWGIGSKLVESLDMDLDRKMDSDTYKFKATLSEQLEQNTEYTVIYRVYDHADRGDTWTTSIETVSLDGTVTINGVEVLGPEDHIYVKTLELGLEVEVTQGADSVERVYCLINGLTVEFNKMPSGVYAAGYTLPEDGTYTFMVYLVDTVGTGSLLASFSIELGSQYQIPLVVISFGAIAAGGLYFYFERQDKAKKPGRRG